MASKMVFSPITSCHLFMGSCEVMNNGVMECLASKISIKAALVHSSKGFMPKSSNISSCCFSIFAILLMKDLSAFVIFNLAKSLGEMVYSTL